MVLAAILRVQLRLPRRSAPAARAAELIAGYQPPSLSEAAAAFARQAAAACAPQNPARAKALLFACGKLGAFASAAGLELDPQVCLHPSVTGRFIVTAGRQLSGPTRRTLRTNLRYAARLAGPQLGPPPVALPRQRSKAPYSAAEIAGYLALADAQPTLARRMRCGALICLGAGAGLACADLRQARGSDITCRSGGVVVEVRGRAPRVVPVASRYHDLLLASAAFARTRLITGGRDPGRRNGQRESAARLADPGLVVATAGRAGGAGSTESVCERASEARRRRPAECR
jgi:hypothetical protein